jgi:hypothetical protein
MVKNSFEEKNTVDKKYTILLGGIKNWMETMRTVCRRKNMEKLKKNCKDQSGIELHKMEQERTLLLSEKTKREDEKKK